MSLRRPALWTLGGAVLCTCALPAQPSMARVTVLQLPRGLHAKEAATGDFNGDGRVDLVVVACQPERTYERSLRVHLAGVGEAPFRGAPDAELALPPDVSAFSVGDVNPSPGDEIALFGASGVVAWLPLAAKAGGLLVVFFLSLSSTYILTYFTVDVFIFGQIEKINARINKLKAEDFSFTNAPPEWYLYAA